MEGGDWLRCRASMTHSPAPTTFCTFMEATSLSRCKLHCGVPVFRSQVNRINKQTVKNKTKKERWSFPDWIYKLSLPGSTSILSRWQPVAFKRCLHIQCNIPYTHLFIGLCSPRKFSYPCFCKNYCVLIFEPIRNLYCYSYLSVLWLAKTCTSSNFIVNIFLLYL